MKVRFDKGKSDTNYHGKRDGERWLTVRGPKLTSVKLSMHPPSTGHRIIFYFTDGSWWFVDVMFIRRKSSDCPCGQCCYEREVTQ